jgi:hypothetical protein
MIGIYKTAKSDCTYNATYFIRMVTDYGGLEAARRLLATNQPSDGFATLWMCGRLDLTVEAHIKRRQPCRATQPGRAVDGLGAGRTRILAGDGWPGRNA